MSQRTSGEQRAASTSWLAALAFGLVATMAIKRPLKPSGAERVQGGAAKPAASARPSLEAKAGETGRSASKPSELPARSWFEILKRVYAEIGRDRVLAVAASVTFYALLAIFPAIVALVSLYGLVADPGTISDQVSSLSGMLPGGALEVISEQVKRIASKPSGSLGFGFAIGLVTALWSANAGMKALFDALNIVYDEEEKRSFVVLNAVSLAFTVGALVIIMLALGAVVVVPVVLNMVGLGETVEVLIGLARWPILLIVVVGALAVLYRYGPSREKAKWRWVTWGSAIATVAWIVGSMLFSWYVSKFGSYNETYGSLGAAIGFMTWIWISSTIVLVGGEINAEMEHQTATDTTQGSGKPIGTRGASMADQVA